MFDSCNIKGGDQDNVTKITSKLKMPDFKVTKTETNIDVDIPIDYMIKFIKNLFSSTRTDFLIPYLK